MARFARIIGDHPLGLDQRLGKLALPVQHGHQIGARRVKAGRQFQRAVETFRSEFGAGQPGVGFEPVRVRPFLLPVRLNDLSGFCRVSGIEGCAYFLDYRGPLRRGGRRQFGDDHEDGNESDTAHETYCNPPLDAARPLWLHIEKNLRVQAMLDSKSARSCSMACSLASFGRSGCG